MDILQPQPHDDVLIIEITETVTFAIHGHGNEYYATVFSSEVGRDKDGDYINIHSDQYKEKLTSMERAGQILWRDVLMKLMIGDGDREFYQHAFVNWGADFTGVIREYRRTKPFLTAPAHFLN